MLYGALGVSVSQPPLKDVKSSEGGMGKLKKVYPYIDCFFVSHETDHVSIASDCLA